MRSSPPFSVRSLAGAWSLLFASLALAAPPGEVTGLTLAADKITVTWDVEPLADHYNLYRGYLMDLAEDYLGVPLEAEISANSIVDPIEPVPGRGFFYLATAANVDGEGTMGPGVSGPRVNTFSWPGRAVAGRWETPRSWPVVAIHSLLLHTGEILSWQGGGDPTTTYTWDPATDLFSTAQVPSDIFCSGHSFLPDGRVYVTGGTIPLFNGRATTWIFDPAAGDWTFAAGMVKGRYYPTDVTMGDGTILMFSGNDENGAINERVERYDSKGQGGISTISGANHSMIIYPAMHLLPDGRVFHTGPEGGTEIFDPVVPSWTFVAATNYGQRGGGSGDFDSVMLPPGHQQFMILGGQGPGRDRATETAEIIDLTQPTPAWRYTAAMNFPRRHPNTVILPDGKVLVAGGGYDDVTPTHPAEIFDAQTESWTVVGSMKGTFRLYHSTALLMPDGRAVWLGGTNPYSYATAEFYSPPYLFRGARPVISSAPASVRYGRTFSIGTPDAASIESVVLIRPGSSTHSRNMSQRYVALSFAVNSGSLDAVAPSEANEAPPGYYLLWIVDNDGVPSEAEFLRLE